MPVFHGLISGTPYAIGTAAAGRGGQARFYTCSSDPTVGLKLYDDPAEGERNRDRLECQARWSRVPGSMLVIEPVAATPGGPVVGCALPLADGDPLGVVLDPPARAAAGRRLDLADLIGVAADAAEGMARNHAAGLVEADVNPGNRLVARTRANGRYPVSVIDMDQASFTARTAAGVMAAFRCPVGQAEYLAPEVSGKDLRTVDRDRRTDAFSLAVLVWNLVKAGSHPFAWRHTSGGPVPALAEIIRAGGFPHAPGNPLPRGVQPLDVGAPFRSFPPAIQALFVRAFRDGHANPSSRPTADEWARELNVWQASVAAATRPSQSRLGGLAAGLVRAIGLSAAAWAFARWRRPAGAVQPVAGTTTAPSAVRWVGAAVAVGLLGIAVTIAGVLVAGRDPRPTDPPPGSAADHPPADPDLFRGVPVWDDLHREPIAPRRAKP